MTNGIGRVGWRNYVSPVPTIWNNLTHYYSGDNTANDSKGTAHGTLVNGTTYGAAKIGSGFSLDGINDYVSLPSGTFNPSGSFTISSWFNITSLPTLKYIIKIGNFLDNSICVYVRSTATTFLVANASDYQVLDAPLPIFNTFNHVVCVKDTVSNKYLIYFNGVLAKQSTITINHSLPNLTTIIGAYNFPGIIDEVGLWDGKALTAAEVTELYNAGAGKQYVAPVASLITTGLILNLDASNSASYPGTGTTWTDLSGNGNNGTLLNGTAYSSENGGTLVLDGINDYVKINNGTGLNLGNEYTFSIWVKFNNFNAVLVGADMWDYYYLMYVGDSNNIYTSGSGGSALLSGVNITTNQWVCLTIVRSATSNTLYKNGVYIASGNPSNSGIVKAIGAYASGSFNLNGKISSVNAYNRSLSSTEVTQNFNATKTRFGL